MKPRYLLFQRGNVFYCEDSLSGKQVSLRTKDPGEAQTLIHARNEAVRQPFLNLRIAQTYLAAPDEKIAERAWQDVMTEFVLCKPEKNRPRCERAIKEAAFDRLRKVAVVETQAEQFLRVLELGTTSTNIYLRRLHNYALGMNWLPWPVLPKKLWPPVHFHEKRGVTREEHRRILERERETERRAFYDLCWHLGGSQSDVAQLKAEDIDWDGRAVSFFRAKTEVAQIMHFGDSLAETLRNLPASGALFPNLSLNTEKQRGSYFQAICRRLKIRGISLHSYRYAWAERARTAGYPERFAQEALGHNSKAVHRAYAKKAHVILPSLEDFEKRHLLATVPLRSALQPNASRAA